MKKDFKVGDVIMFEGQTQFLGHFKVLEVRNGEQFDIKVEDLSGRLNERVSWADSGNFKKC